MGSILFRGFSFGKIWVATAGWGKYRIRGYGQIGVYSVKEGKNLSCTTLSKAITVTVRRCFFFKFILMVQVYKIQCKFCHIGGNKS